MLLLLGTILSTHAQTYYGHALDHGQDLLMKMDQGCQCPQCCVMSEVGPTKRWETRIAISPAREVFGIAYNGLSGDPELYKIDTLTGNSTLLLSMHGLEVLKGLIAMGDGIFYTMEGPTAAEANKLIKIDIVTNSITVVGNLFPKSIGDPCFFEGEIYYPSVFLPPFNIRHISKLNLEEPNQSKPVAYVPFEFRLVGVCATNICNTLIGVDTLGVDQLVYVNLKDGDWQVGTGSAIPMCHKTDGLTGITSVQELKTPAICNLLDLDCNNSSMALDEDFNADTIDCLHSKVKIVDTDVQAFHDTAITELRIELTGFVPDGALEYLEITGDIYTIEAWGDGTHSVKLENGGPATFADFNYMLQRIYYHNDALYPTGGTRTIEFKFITEFGTESDIATAFIPVIELPLYPVDLGNDTIKCDGDALQLDATSPGAQYLWNTGSTQAKIWVNNPGTYSVYLHGLDKCPNWDTIYVGELPVVEAGLSGDNIYCGDEQPELHFIINSTFNLDITVSTSEDTTLVFNNISSSEFVEVDIPLGTEIVYTITNVVSSPDACIEINNDEVIIGHFPSYEQIFHKSICDGDSIIIGYEYESAAGTYDRALYTEAGCDSNVTVELSLLPLAYTYSSIASCDITEVGVFSLVLTGVNGCDSTHQTTVTYLPPDTTLLLVPSCRQADAGVFQTIYTNADGCDSLVITNSPYVPPIDTTHVTLLSCDVSELGTFLSLATDASGCDSISITNVILAPTDTTYLFSSSCHPGNVGVFESLMNGADGCDSLIISTVSFSLADTTFSFSTSCDSASLGVHEYHFTGTDGCDSTDFNTVTYSAIDSVSISGTSCDPDDVGVFSQHYVNQFGCDSVVTQTITLLPANTTSISSSTCDPSSAGTFVYNLTNQFGCDSIVTETVTLLPVSQTFLTATTCRSSEVGVFVETFPVPGGCDSIVTLTVTLVHEDTTQLFFNTCDPDEVGDVENTFTNQDGCDSLVISTFDLFPLPEVDVVSTADYNGFGISCFGENNGSLSATATGSGPFEYEWSTGSGDQLITGLGAGNYAVTITDANGCITSDVMTLAAPLPFSISLVLNEPDCFGQESGDIFVTSQGGVAPARYSLNQINYQSSPDFNNLNEGTYTISAIDANGCTAQEVTYLEVALQVNVELGDNFVVEIGDTAVLNAIVDVPYDSIASVVWTGLPTTSCPACLSQSFTPSQTATYSVLITTHDGCTAEDEITVRIGRHTDILVPNIFSPNGDGQNDILFITAGKEIESIASFVIYDRWGNLVFDANNFPPNDPSFGWDGTWKEKYLNSSVFAYRLIAVLKNGTTRVVSGDVTILR